MPVVIVGVGGVDMLSNIDRLVDQGYVKVLASVVVTDSRFNMPVQLAHVMPLFARPISRSIITFLDCARVLQARIPSYHV